MKTARRRPRIVLVVGARPNFVKAAALWRALARYGPRWEVRLLHTDQHHDRRMSAVFFSELGLPRPEWHLQVRAAHPGEQIGRMMAAATRRFLRWRPDLVMVVGDVNSTLAAALAARVQGIPVAHVEAGLRSFDERMPEELNRRLTDAISSYLFTTSQEARRNLLREGAGSRRIHFAGNVMVDTLMRMRRHAASSRIVETFGLPRRGYAVVTLHRPSNVDDAGTLADLLQAVERIARRLPVVFPVHPRTRRRLLRLRRRPAQPNRLLLIPPLGYLQFQRLLQDARLVLTDSGGIQEEASVLGIPCLTLRHNTERPETVRQGTNRVVGTSPHTVVRAAAQILNGGSRRPRHIARWDGRAAERIAAVLARAMGIARKRS